MSCLSAGHVVRLAVPDSGANSQTNGAETDASFHCHASLSAQPDLTSTALTPQISQHRGRHLCQLPVWKKLTGTPHAHTQTFTLQISHPLKRVKSRRQEAFVSPDVVLKLIKIYKVSFIYRMTKMPAIKESGSGTVCFFPPSHLLSMCLLEELSLNLEGLFSLVGGAV